MLAALIDAPLALAFGAGMLAAVNPCGFAMLPAYLSYFVGLEGATSHATSSETAARSAPQNEAPERGLLRALGVGAIMTAGFVSVFGAVGLVVTQISSSVMDHAKWATILIGLALVVVGVALLAGRQLSVRLPRLDRGGSSRELGSMLLFGISYAIASLGCTLPTFLSATSSSFSRSGFASGMATFFSYALGMGMIVTALTVAVALARGSVVLAFRQVLPYVSRLSGALVLVAGLYVTYYGWYEVRLARGGAARDPVVDRALGVQGRMSDLIDTVGTTRLGLLCALVVVAVAAVGWRARRGRRARQAEPNRASATAA
jgi:cytochrome c biogenesis protein CcdA